MIVTFALTVCEFESTTVTVGAPFATALAVKVVLLVVSGFPPTVRRVVSLE